MNQLLLFGAGTAVGAFFEKIKAFFLWISSILIVSCEINGPAAQHLLRYLLKHHRMLQPKYGLMYAWLPYWASGRMHASIYKTIDDNNHHFMVGRSLLRFKFKNRYADWMKVKVSFVRNSIDLKELVRQAGEAYEIECSDSKEGPSKRSRFFVQHIVGKEKDGGASLAILMSSQKEDKGASVGDVLPSGAADDWVLETFDEDHSSIQKQYDPFGHMSLSLEMKSMIQEATSWYNNQAWFHERYIPWRCSFLLEGPAGTGKTSMVRCVGKQLDIPIFHYDLGSLSNSELHKAWMSMQSNSPCIALFEDIDGIFKGREPIGNTKVTFDFLLNCIDGIDESNGLMICATTNHSEHIDPALLRPGRLGRTIKCSYIDHVGKCKMANRILKDDPSAQQQVISSTNGNLTPAEFEQLCCNQARMCFSTEGSLK